MPFLQIKDKNAVPPIFKEDDLIEVVNFITREIKEGDRKINLLQNRVTQELQQLRLKSEETTARLARRELMIDRFIEALDQKKANVFQRLINRIKDIFGRVCGKFNDTFFPLRPKYI